MRGVRAQWCGTVRGNFWEPRLARPWRRSGAMNGPLPPLPPTPPRPNSVSSRSSSSVSSASNNTNTSLYRFRRRRPCAEQVGISSCSSVYFSDRDSGICSWEDQNAPARAPEGRLPEVHNYNMVLARSAYSCDHKYEAQELAVYCEKEGNPAQHHTTHSPSGLYYTVRKKNVVSAS